MSPVRSRSELEAELDKWPARALLPALPASLLSQAFVHRSYVHDHGEGPDNERLEFLGDAVVGLVISEHLYANYPDLPEGALSRLKSALVSRRTLAAIGRRLGLRDLLLLGRGEEASGVRERLSLVGNALEALVGCVYLSAGREAAREFILAAWKPELEDAGRGSQVDPKSALQERTQGRWKTRPSYRLAGVEGPDHARRFLSEVYLGEKLLGRGEGPTKKAAEQEAAAEGLRWLDARERDQASQSN
ncbi:MAG: ribonuclease III [Chitinophagales bacterium]